VNAILIFGPFPDLPLPPLAITFPTATDMDTIKNITNNAINIVFIFIG
jgi:hypothetical protein